ncbi:AbrB/MazE/SpoVT family DNA-binding domain-containing protein [Niallia sp. Krafla_26]|uniref:AbrB/MazE/SpoVT family DNA-binding domain-containing protein n=1 Tax=Niallia sp. Krafla_26 TaxID=3064703 RepID=UPI003D17689D
MKALGIVRKIDDLGRVVIPMEVRRTNGWETGTPVELFSTEEGLLIREYGREQEVVNLLAELDKADQLASNESIKLAINKAREFIAKG